MTDLMGMWTMTEAGFGSYCISACWERDSYVHVVIHVLKAAGRSGINT
jgi:hypothetical protein